MAVVTVSSLLLATAGLSMVQHTAAQLTLAQSDFSSGDSIEPFVECTFRRPSYAAVSNGELEVFFDEKDYDGTRMDRGIEICAETVPVTRELWHGFSILVPAEYPQDKQSIISQHFCLGGCSSWCATLDIQGNSLQVDHRSSCSPTGNPSKIIVDDIVRDEWHDVVINARFSNSEDGRYIVWWNGKVIYSVENINLGFDTEWTSDGRMTVGVGFKNGQYNAGECQNDHHVTSTTSVGDIDMTTRYLQVQRRHPHPVL